MRILAGAVSAQNIGAAGAQTPYDKFFNEYYFPHNPTAATAAGIHKYDDKLEDYPKAANSARIAALKKYLAEFEKLPADADRDLVLSSIRASLLELEVIRGWEKNPDNYSSGISNSAFVIMSRTFAPPAQRLRSLIERERQVAQVLVEARANLKSPPRVYTEIALEQLPGIGSFFADDVPKALNKVTDAKLLAEFKQVNATVIAALKDYEKWLRTDLLARSNGDFKIGAENYAKKLLYEEMVDVPLDRLVAVGYDNLRANQKAFREVAAKIDPKKTPQQILEELEKDHPPADKLLDAFRDVNTKLRAFILARKIITIPSPVLPILEGTPPFARALTTPSMDTPGPYETVAKEAYFNVTVPEKGWKAERVEDYMRGFHRGVILSTAIHEAFPGHYIQFLWIQRVPSRVRKLMGSNSNAEGWAHYCEQMILDEGYAKDDQKARLGQLQDALLRNARYIVGIEIHTGKRTFEQAVDFFIKEGFQTKETAVKETKRGTSDPTYLVYTLGKLQIMKLRGDYKQTRGAQFSLQEFHDNFMKQGFPPIKIVRRAMLGNDSPTL